jgi:hypothetical protein
MQQGVLVDIGRASSVGIAAHIVQHGVETHPVPCSSNACEYRWCRP